MTSVYIKVNLFGQKYRETQLKYNVDTFESSWKCPLITLKNPVSPPTTHLNEYDMYVISIETEKYYEKV